MPGFFMPALNKLPGSATNAAGVRSSLFSFYPLHGISPACVFLYFVGKQMGMKMTVSRILAAIILSTLFNQASGQILTEANKCYDDRKYDCAVAKYLEALKAKVYQEKDLATIQYRIGYGYTKLGKQKEAIPFFQGAIKSKPEWGSPVWELAYAYYQLDSFTRANEYYGKTAAFYKNDTASLKRIYYWKGLSQFNNKAYTGAFNDFMEAYKIDSTEDYVVVALGDAAYQNKKYSDAKKYYGKGLRNGEKFKLSDDKMGVRYFLYAQSLHNLREFDESQAMFDKAMSHGYEQRQIYWGLGGSNYNQKQYREAADYYTKAIREYTGDSSSLKTLYYWRGRSYSGLKDYTKAQADFNSSIKYDENYQDSYIENAGLLRKLKKYKEAIAVYDNALKKFRSGSYYKLAELHYGRGMVYLEMKDTLHAKSDLLFAVEFDYSMPEAQVQLGHLAFHKKNYSGARIHYGYVSDKLDVDSATFSFLHFRKGFSNFLGGKSYYSVAKADFLKSLQYDSLNKDAHRYIADIYFSESQFAQAEKEMSRCIQLFAKDKDSLVNMYRYRMQIRNQQKNYKDALADYEQINKLKPITNADEIKHMGQLAFEIKEYDKAIGWFTQLTGKYTATQKSDLLFTYYARGRSYYEQKKKVNAVQDLQKALEYEPGNAEVKSWLTKAEQLP